MAPHPPQVPLPAFDVALPAFDEPEPVKDSNLKGWGGEIDENGKTSSGIPAISAQKVDVAETNSQILKVKVRRLLSEIMYIPAGPPDESCMSLRQVVRPGEPVMLSRQAWSRPTITEAVRTYAYISGFQFLVSIPVVMGGAFPFLIDGALARAFPEQLMVADRTRKDMEIDVDFKGTTVAVTWLAVLPHTWLNIYFAIVWYLLLAVQVNPSICRGIYMRTGVVWISAWLCLSLLRPPIYQMSSSKANSSLDRTQSAANTLAMFTTFALYFFRGLAKIGSKFAGVIAVSSTFVCFVVYGIVRVNFATILFSSDATKAFGCIFVMPLSFQLLVYLPHRLSARMLHNVDPIVRWPLIAGAINLEKALTRVIMLTIGNAWVVLLTSVLNSAMGGLVRGILGENDFRAYRFFQRIGADGDWEQIFWHAPNYYLQPTIVLCEITIDIASVWAGFFMFVGYDVQLRAHENTNFSEIGWNAVLQTGAETFSLLVIYIYSVYWRNDDLWTVWRRLPCFSIVMLALQATVGSSMISSGLLPNLLCVPRGGIGTWCFCKA